MLYSVGPVVATALLLVLSGCSAQDGSSADINNQDRRVQIEVETLTPVDLVESFTLPARLEPREDLLISAELAGTVTALHVAEGTGVAPGDRLLQIDADALRTQLRKEEQNVQAVNGRYERFKRLFDEGLVSRQDLDDAENALAAARSALRQAQLQYAKGAPLSPMAGVIDRLHVELGEYVDPGKPLLRLVRTDQLKVVADVPEKDVLFLRTGQQVALVPAVIQGDDPEPLSAVIDHVALVADELSRTFRTTMTVEQPGLSLRSGMIVRVTFLRQHHQQVIAVPLYAVLDRRDRKVVYVADGDKAREVEIVAGSIIGQNIIIRSGLEFGQQLVVKGQHLLIDGAPVRIGGH